MEFVLPVLCKYPAAARAVVLVDRDIEQAHTVARHFGLKHVCADYTSLPIEVDAAMITTPHKFHAVHSLHFLGQGKHVFVEKPLGMSADEVTAMVDAASARGLILMVNNYRRLFASYQHVRELVQSGRLGELRRITVFDGTQFAWNSASSFYLRDPATRGVFLDRGAHTIDTLCWWLGRTPEVVSARNDAFGGVEAVMDVQLSSRDARIDLKFSRLYRLANSFAIEGDTATVTGRLFDFGQLQLKHPGQTERINVGTPLPHYEYAWQLVENFLRAVQGLEAPHFVARDVAPSISLIERAYRFAKRYESPWYDHDPNIQQLKEHLANE
jgi:predicted dehydrogenase